MTTDQNEFDNGTDMVPQRAGNLARRDFSGTSLAVGSAQTDALIAKERASVEARWIMAMRQPRNLDVVRQMILKECRRPGFADVAVYEVPRGEGKITGLSIRFAEVAVRCMGNVQPEVVTIYDDTESRIVRCTVTDYESNVTWSKDLSIRKTVERKFLKKGQRPLGERINSSGDRVYIVEATDDDVATKEAAQVSKALRTLILRCVPGHIQDEALQLCNAVYADKAAKDPDAERVRVLDAFNGLGVLATEIEEFLGHPSTRMSPAELDKLRKVYAAVADGHATWADALAEQLATRAKTPAATGPAASSGPAPTTAPATTTSAPAAAPTTNGAPAQQPATTASAPAASKAPRSKGTAGLKAQLTEQPKSDKPPTSFDTAAQQARERDAARTTEDPREAEPGWMSGKPDERGIPAAELSPEMPADEPPPPDGFENRACAGCRAWIQIERALPAGQKCYSCQQA